MRFRSLGGDGKCDEILFPRSLGVVNADGNVDAVGFELLLSPEVSKYNLLYCLLN